MSLQSLKFSTVLCSNSNISLLYNYSLCSFKCFPNWKECCHFCKLICSPLNIWKLLLKISGAHSPHTYTCSEMLPYTMYSRCPTYSGYTCLDPHTIRLHLFNSGDFLGHHDVPLRDWNEAIMMFIFSWDHCPVLWLMFIIWKTTIAYILSALTLLQVRE